MGIALSAAFGMLAPLAMAEERAVSSGTAVAPPPLAARSALLPPPPRLQLSWPVAPVAFSFHASPQGNHATGPLSSFRAEALWLRQGPLSLLSVSRAELAFELDCRSTCQPMLERAVSVEARLPTPSPATR
jgi:hypothetical protein